MAYSTVAGTPYHVVYGSINPPGFTGAKLPLRPVRGTSHLFPCVWPPICPFSSASASLVNPFPSGRVHARFVHASSSRDADRSLERLVETQADRRDFKELCSGRSPDPFPSLSDLDRARSIVCSRIKSRRRETARGFIKGFRICELSNGLVSSTWAATSSRGESVFL